MRHPFDGIIVPDEGGGEPSAPAAEAAASRRSVLAGLAAALGGAVGLLFARPAAAQSARGRERGRAFEDRVTTQALGEEGGPGRDDFRSRRPDTPPGRDRITTQAIGEEGGPGRDDLRSRRPDRPRGRDRVTTLALGEEG